LTEEEKEEIKNKIFVGIDPGWGDIIFCTDGVIELIKKKNGTTIHKARIFRYSRQQRRKELKIKRYRDILENDKNTTKIDNNKVKDIESTLSKYNLNSCEIEYCKSCIKKKNEINKQLMEYYQKDIHRKLQWYSYLNKCRSDANMINEFRKKFGSPNDVVILMGDFGAKGTLSGSEPVKGKSIRKLFKNAGYRLYLVDEYNTSKYLYQTGEELEKFRKRESPRPYKKGSIRLVHGLLRVKSKTGIPSTDCEISTKTTLINRDLNGALEIRLKGYNTINNIPIPSYLLRTKTKDSKNSSSKCKAVKKDTVKKDTVEKIVVKKDTVEKIVVKKDAVKKIVVKKDAVKKDTVKKIAVKKDTMKKPAKKIVKKTDKKIVNGDEINEKPIEIIDEKKIDGIIGEIICEMIGDIIENTNDKNIESAEEPPKGDVYSSKKTKNRIYKKVKKLSC